MTSSLPYADVALDVPRAEPFQYAVPPELDAAATVGALVRVPFGPRERIGVIVERTTEKKAAKLKELRERVTPAYQLDHELLELGRWIAEYYMCGLGETLRTVSMIGFRSVARKTSRLYCLREPKRAAKWLAGEEPAPTRLTPQRRSILAALLKIDNQALPAAELAQMAETGAEVLRVLAERGVLECLEQTIIREDEYPQTAADEAPFTLTPSQQAAYDQLVSELDSGSFHASLLHGITSSGKTEIYLQAIAHALKSGRQAIVLVPEIALTPQTVERFRRRFGRRVGVYHSRLNIGQKFDLYRRIVAGEVEIVIGARSAVFTPFPRLGLIVIDEEPEGSYKQENAPCYHARDVALMRAQKIGACVVMGSATPSLESFHNAREGKFTLLTLPERLGSASLPQVKLIDMRREAEVNQNLGLFSRELSDSVRQRLSDGEQTILFLNRRGYHSIVMCRACSLVIGCAQCDVIMTYHKVRERLVCHLCGASRPAPHQCPECASPNLHALGMGTERIEEEITREFPDARAMRIDLDTTSSKFAFLDKWRTLSEGNVDIILGTQMIAKGLDLPKVTLVGVVMADVSLFQPDFRAAERTFSILTQVAGRAGRRDKPGEVFIQTYCPHHYGIQFAQTHDYLGFFAKEMTVRRILRFPPHYRLISLVVSGKHADNTRTMADGVGFAIRRVIGRGFEDDAGEPAGDPAIAVLGPAPSIIAIIKGRYRWRLLLRGLKPSLMRTVVREGLAEFHRRNPRPQVQIAIDVDPIDLR